MKKQIYLIAAGIVLVGILATVFYGISTNNTQIDLSTRITAQKTVTANYYDKMWKILKQKAGVADKYKTAFKDIYTGLIEGRYDQPGSDGSLMKFIHESNPNFDASLYRDLMNSIEVERTGFYNEQNKLIDLGREHTNLLRKIPSRWFLGDVKPIKIAIITSAKTKGVMASGEENNIEL